MHTDIVEALRDRRVCSPAQNSCRNDHICEVAAQEIERLREALLRTDEVQGPPTWPQQYLRDEL